MAPLSQLSKEDDRIHRRIDMNEKTEIICHSWQEVIDQVNSLPEDQEFCITLSEKDEGKELDNAGD